MSKPTSNIYHLAPNRNRDRAIVGALLLIPEPDEGQQKATRESPTCSVSGRNCPEKKHKKTPIKKEFEYYTNSFAKSNRTKPSSSIFVKVISCNVLTNSGFQGVFTLT